MTPQEIIILKRYSPTFCKTLKMYRDELWPFLRKACLYPYGTLCCECATFSYPVIETAYRVDLCVACLIHEVLDRDPILDCQRDPRSKDYDAKYAASCDFWDDIDTDGPPILYA